VILSIVNHANVVQFTITLAPTRRHSISNGFVVNVDVWMQGFFFCVEYDEYCDHSISLSTLVFWLNALMKELHEMGEWLSSITESSSVCHRE
jgi:hypothetical protein